jgi:CheY-like chemotaxis protein
MEYNSEAAPPLLTAGSAESAVPADVVRGAGPSRGVGASVNERGAIAPPERRLRILVVEDEPTIAMLLGELLAAMGHEVCALASDEAGAVALAAFHRPDLMIVDATLGAGSGVRAVDTAILGGPSPHLFTSGDALAVRLVRPDSLVLQKPYNEADLAAAIHRAIQ